MSESSSNNDNPKTMKATLIRIRIASWFLFLMSVLFISILTAQFYSRPRFGPNPALYEELLKSIYCPDSPGISLFEAMSSPDVSCGDMDRMTRAIRAMIKKGEKPSKILAAFKNVPKQEEPLSVFAKTGCSGDGALRADVFIMSLCPFGMLYVWEHLPAMKKAFGDSVKFTPRFIVDVDSTGKFNSMHGKPELDEDRRQICILDKKGLNAWLDYTKCLKKRGKNGSFNASDSLACISVTGISRQDLNRCTSKESSQLLKRDIALARKYKVNASPSVVFDCRALSTGARSYNTYLKDLCKLFKTAPDVCK